MKKKNILIIGALGNIGGELIENFSKKKFNKYNFFLIDRKFEHNIIGKLKKNFYFHLSDVYSLDKKTQSFLNKADVVFFLSAEVEAEKSINREKYIWQQNYDNPKKIINKLRKKTRFFFTSSGNIFGGLPENSKYLGLNEEDKPYPKYPYAETKFAVEKYLKKKHKNWTILRLGTNYGHSIGMRFNIVTNKFMKSALLNQNITIHGKGSNFRPAVCVKDVARAMIFLMNKQEAKNEIFHLSNESPKISELAKKVINSMKSKSKLENIAKEVPFNSYGLSGNKLKKIGFKFNWTIEKASRDFKKKFKFKN